MKNLKLFSVSALLALLLLCVGTAFAADTVGVVDMQRVLFSHPRIEQVTKRIEAIYQAKDKEVKAALAKVTDKKKAAEVVDKKRREVAEEEMKLKEPIFKEIRLAIRTVARAKNLSVIVEASAVHFGGIDITADVVQELKKKNSSK
ncbi:MAG: OmpH family outer membrane protein [Pyramidobacter sp.]|nr:OmpH family outer membrane protein [Pyramidobacter sp.]